MEPAEYCREIEDYLCRKNEGHLIRIVGPAFEQVCGWAASGVPLKVAFRGIDQYCERYYAKGARRRPVRIEFCEADILDLFDGWRRAIGVSGRNGAEEEPVAQPVPRKPALASHVERAIARLKAPGPARPRSPTLDDAVASAVQELERIGASAKQARGDERARLIDVLAGIDRALVAQGPEHDALLAGHVEGTQPERGDARHQLLGVFLGRVRLQYDDHSPVRSECEAPRNEEAHRAGGGLRESRAGRN